MSVSLISILIRLSLNLDALKVTKIALTVALPHLNTLVSSSLPAMSVPLFSSLFHFQTHSFLFSLIIFLTLIRVHTSTFIHFLSSLILLLLLLMMIIMFREFNLIVWCCWFYWKKRMVVFAGLTCDAMMSRNSLWMSARSPFYPSVSSQVCLWVLSLVLVQFRW